MRYNTIKYTNRNILKKVNRFNMNKPIDNRKEYKQCRYSKINYKDIENIFYLWLHKGGNKNKNGYK